MISDIHTILEYWVNKKKGVESCPGLYINWVIKTTYVLFSFSPSYVVN